MFQRRAVIPLGLLLFIALLSTVVRITGPTAASPRVTASPTPTPAPTRVSGPARAVAHSLAAVERAYNAGDVLRLCRAGALVDPAVIRQQSSRTGGCESELETLMANKPPLRLTARRVMLRPDLATAAVAAARGTAVPIDFVRHGRRWLLSFSDGADPMPALAAAG